MRKINPIGNRVLLQRDNPKDTTESGLIVIPDVAKEKLTVGKVWAVGPGRVLESGKRVEPMIKKGDRVLFGKYSGNEFELDGEKNLLLMTEDDIYGVLEE